MAAITDLTWQQLSDKLSVGAIELIAAVPAATPPTPAQVKIDLTKLTGNSVDALADLGVIKALALLLDAALNAQSTANDGQVVGERLASFPAVVVGGVVNGYVPMTRAVVSRHQLITSTNIVGQVA